MEAAKDALPKHLELIQIVIAHHARTSILGSSPVGNEILR